MAKGKNTVKETKKKPEKTKKEKRAEKIAKKAKQFFREKESLQYQLLRALLFYFPPRIGFCKIVYKVSRRVRRGAEPAEFVGCVIFLLHKKKYDAYFKKGD